MYNYIKNQINRNYGMRIDVTDDRNSLTVLQFSTFKICKKFNVVKKFDELNDDDFKMFRYYFNKYYLLSNIIVSNNIYTIKLLSKIIENMDAQTAIILSIDLRESEKCIAIKIMKDCPKLLLNATDEKFIYTDDLFTYLNNNYIGGYICIM
jgi:hypothetical protein